MVCPSSPEKLQTVPEMKAAICDRLLHNVGKATDEATQKDWLLATAYAVRDKLMEQRLYTRRQYQASGAKRVYYLSLEFLPGRTLLNSLLNLGVFDICQQALTEMGVDLMQIETLESDAGLGNGGLGRLAACILDSLATQCLPGYGYGIRYEFGMFRQAIENGQQVEHPDNWLRHGSPWETPQPEITYVVPFYGHVVAFETEEHSVQHHWKPSEEVVAMAYDHPIPGHGRNNNVNVLRLWASKSSRDFDLDYFNEGDYLAALEHKNQSETISKVLYPNDATAVGRELRLKQEFFFVSASLQDIINRHTCWEKQGIETLPERAILQLNDTHPAIAVAELMRLLLDHFHLSWNESWRITTQCFAYTNHTLMPEALETWPVDLMEKVLPRHLQIIFEINHHFLTEIRHLVPGDNELLRKLSLIDEDGERRIRMAHLAVVGSHKVNGVAALHTELLKAHLFHDFNQVMPDKFINVTNGITPRLWLNQANQHLAQLITERLGSEDWVTDLSQLQGLESAIDDEYFLERFHAIKQANKQRLATLIEKRCGIRVNTNSLFDIQIKRIHEYKRQLLNLMHVITRYNRIRLGHEENPTPRVVLFAGKAAPGYARAKEIIRLINDVADVINNDPRIGDLLKVVFVPNYDVSSAAIIIPAANLSEQISTAGTEASGTGNMKLALNGALTIGTLDGANVEMADAIGHEHLFIFGHTTEQVHELDISGYNPHRYYEEDHELQQVVDMLNSDFFCPGDPGRYAHLVHDLLTHDRFKLLADYRAYVDKQAEIDALYHDHNAWIRKSLLNTARMGYFSIDRTVAEYAKNIWQIDPMCYTDHV